MDANNIGIHRAQMPAALNVEPLNDYTGEEIRGVRRGLGMTQAFFAMMLGVSKKTVEAWEAGRNKPTGPARRILALLQKDPDLLNRYNIVR